MKRSPALLLLAAAALPSCKEGTSQSGSQFDPIPPPVSANQGCNGALPALALQMPGFASAAIGAGSQIVAVAGTETLYLTGADGSVRLLDVGMGFPPAETVQVAPGVVDGLLSSVGIASPASLSGITVLDAANLVVVEETSNTLLLVSRLTPDTVSFLAGFPSETPGNADGPGAAIRFSFDLPTQVVAAGSGALYLADPGNHGVRLLLPGVLPESDTIAGLGVPLFRDGVLLAAGFDTPTGLAVTCAGELLVTETGAGGLGGHRLRSLRVGDPAFFGGFEGSAVTLAGDGTDATTGGMGTAARLAAPVAPVTTSDGEVLWIDSTTGILRRLDLATGVADCPLFASCADAVAMGGSFTPGGNFSLAITASSALYVLDGAAGTLFRATP